MKFCRIVLTSVLFIISFSSIHANWHREVTHFTSRDYTAGSTNNCIAIRDNGWVYTANPSGLLEFDGSFWNTYPLPGDQLLTIKIGGDGKVYAGGTSKFGYYVPDATGGLDFICLSDSLPDTIKKMPVKDIHISPDGVYYQTESFIYHWTDDAIKTVKSKSRITGSAIIRNHFYLATERGLYVLNGDEPLLMANTDAMEKMKVIALLPYKDKLLMVSSKNGLHLYDGYSLETYSTGADLFLSGKEIISAAINDSLLVLGTQAHGIYLLGLQTGEGEAISFNNGLQDNTVNSVAFDRKQNLWLGLNHGIDCVNLSAPYYQLHSKNGRIGAGTASAVYNNQIYLGTNKGLFRTIHPSSFQNPFTEEDVYQVAGGPVHDLLVHDNKLFCASGQGILILDRNFSHSLPVGSIRYLRRIGKDNETILAVGESGLLFLKKSHGNWNVTGRIPELPYIITGIEASTGELWIADRQKGILKLTLSEDLSGIIQEKSYRTGEEMDNRSIHMAFIDDEIVFLSDKQLYRYNPSKDAIERFLSLENRLHNENGYHYITQLDNEDIWYVAGDKLHINSFQNDTYIHRNYPIPLAAIHNLSDKKTLQQTDRNTIIWGTDTGFFLFDPAKINPQEPGVQVQIRKFYTTNGKDSLVYGRNYIYDDRTVQLPHVNNAICFVYSSLQNHPGHPVRYSVKLDGVENSQWGDYSEHTVKEYTGLPAGKYTFHVKAQSSGTEMPETASLSFCILPPWYAAGWAWLLYILLAVGAVYLIRKYRSYIHLTFTRPERKDKELIAEATPAGRMGTEGLQEELNDKTKELFRTTVSIIRKNEMLEDIRKKVLDISQTLEVEKATVSREKANRLLEKIHSNIAHDEDMKAFAKSFDALRGNFFKLLEERFPHLNQKDKMMCCYIKMNLLSKEIAPLLNISVRGVEISRYRLRKKLNLQEKDNMAEYLQNLS